MKLLKAQYIILHLIILLCLNTNVNAQIDHWETIVYPTDTCTYLTTLNFPAAGWTQLDFDDSGWVIDKGGLGYGDGDDNTIISPTSSLYIRYIFEIIDIESIDQLFLDADYDDGFVAYLNGRLIARSNVENDLFTGSNKASSLHEALLYQGLIPERFILSNAETKDLLQDGKNILAIEVHNFNGVESSDLSSNFYLSAGINDDTQLYSPVPFWFEEPITSFTSRLPIIKITSESAIVDEPKRPAILEIIWNDDAELNDSEQSGNHYTGPISIEKRGESSLALFPKVGYGFETVDQDGEDLDVSFLNFPEEEDWILHGPYSDKSLMRNVLAMHIGNEMGSYHSRTRFVELVINQEYLGVYVMMEKIKRDKNRVDINKLKDDEIEGDDLTGGYVIKIDKGEQDWFSKYQIMDREEYTGFQYVSPNSSSIVAQQEEYIQSYIDSMEQALASNTYTYGGKRYDEYLDIESFADHLILKELAKDVDAYRISSFYYKDKNSKGGKLKAGPAWDFNIAFGNVNYCDGNSIEGWMYDVNCIEGIPFWWSRLLNRPEFRDVLRCRWQELTSGPLSIESINSYIDDQVTQLGSAVDRNFQKWPILFDYIWPNDQIRGSFESEVSYVKSFIARRHAWINANLGGECNVVANDNQAFDLHKITIHPNPATTSLGIELPLEYANATLIIYDAYGKSIDEIICLNEVCISDISHLNPGIYAIHLFANKRLIGIRKFIKI